MKYSKNVFLLVLLITMNSLVLADHITVSGDVSGEWNTDTVMVTGDLTVPDGEHLLIMPGTVVEFQGSFAFNVQGSVTAIGLQEENIYFTVADTAGFNTDTIPDGGWRGIRFDHNRASNDLSEFIHCSFYFGKVVSSDPLTGNGGAIYVKSYDKVSISNCLFQDNFATYNGGAVYLDSADIAISHSSFARNRCGPAIAPWGYGGAVCSDNSSPDIRWNIFDNNTSTGVGGGLAVRYKDCMLYNNVFKSNVSGLGGAFGFLHIPEINYRIINNLVAGNYAVYFGGGVANLEASPIYINNTIVYNQAMYGGGFYCKDSISPAYYNTIIWGNMAGAGPQGYLFEVYSQADFFNCDVEGGPALFGGSGGGAAFSGAWEQCLDTVPGFMGSGEFPYSPGDNSPCIDTGSPDTSGFMLPATDLAGNPRICNDRIDIGAYEWFTIGIFEQAENEDPVRVWPNPFRDQIWMELNLEKGEKVVIEIFDFSGKKIYSTGRAYMQAGRNYIQWKNNHIRAQSYLLKVFIGEQVVCKKLIKVSQ